MLLVSMVRLLFYECSPGIVHMINNRLVWIEEYVKYEINDLLTYKFLHVHVYH